MPQFSPSIAGLLSTIAPDYLSDLSLIFSTSDATGASWAEFARIATLDAVLSSPRFSSLKRFNVQCQVYRKDKHAMESLECRDRMFQDWLPNVDPKIWIDDFADTFDI